MVCTQYSFEPTRFIIEQSSALMRQVKEMGIQEINRCSSYYLNPYCTRTPSKKVKRSINFRRLLTEKKSKYLKATFSS